MEKVGFIGAYDKIDCILYIAKILRTVGKKVLVVDSTINQKAKYIVPVINPTVSYVTEFEEMDVAVGFEDFDAIKNYLGVPEQNELDYDYALVSLKKLLKDKVMIIVNSVMILGILIITYSPLNTFLKLKALTIKDLLIVILISFISVFWYEIVKFYVIISKRQEGK